MTQWRLPLLLAVATALAASRWWLSPFEQAPSHSEVVAAVERRPVEPTAVAASSGRVSAPELDVQGNAFSARMPPSPPAPPPPPPKPFVGPPPPPPYVPPPPPPPPPLQVIGTWDDGKSPGVFIALPQGGTALARAGAVLLTDYKMTAVTPQYVIFTHISSKHEWRLPIPSVGSRP